jgi:hypothetical protein
MRGSSRLVVAQSSSMMRVSTKMGAGSIHPSPKRWPMRLPQPAELPPHLRKTSKTPEQVVESSNSPSPGSVGSTR